MDRGELIERFMRDIVPERSVAGAIADAVLAGVPEAEAVESIMDIYLVSFERNTPPGLYHLAKPWETQSRLLVYAAKGGMEWAR